MTITFPIPLKDAAPQVLNGNTLREHCAMVNVLSALMRKEEVKSTTADLVTWFKRNGIPDKRAAQWIKGYNGERLGDIPITEVAGLLLSEYQKTAAASLTIAGGIMAMACGMGKTITAVAAALSYRAKGLCGPRLWIAAPVNAIGAWKRYIPTLKEHFTEVELVSMDSLHHCLGLDPSPGGILIADEAHYVGAWSSQRSKNITAVRKAFDVCLCLTGTLLHSGIEKAITVMDLAVPGAALFVNQYTAGAHFKCLVAKDIPYGAGTKRVIALERPTGENFVAFSEYISRITHFATRDSQAFKDAVGTITQESQLIQLGNPRSLDDEIMEAALYLREKTGELPTLSGAIMYLRRAGLEAKMEWLETLILDGEPTVLFAWSLESLKTLRLWLDQNGLDYGYVDGTIHQRQREQIVQNFQTGQTRLFLGQMDASCVSIDLFKSARSVAIEHTNRAANYDQALGRTARRGQDRHCVHYDLAANSLQAAVIKRLRDGVNFDSHVAEWAQARAVLTTVSATTNLSNGAEQHD